MPVNAGGLKEGIVKMYESNLMLAEKQLLEIGRNPVFYSRELRQLKKVLLPNEKLISSADGFLELFEAEGTAFATNLRIIFIGFRKNRIMTEDLYWKSLVSLKSHISEAFSSLGFVGAFKSLYITQIESPFMAKVFYRQIRAHLHKKTRINTPVKKIPSEIV